MEENSRNPPVSQFLRAVVRRTPHARAIEGERGEYGGGRGGDEGGVLGSGEEWENEAPSCWLRLPAKDIAGLTFDPTEEEEDERGGEQGEREEEEGERGREGERKARESEGEVAALSTPSALGAALTRFPVELRSAEQVPPHLA